MIEKLKHKYALSSKGANDMARAFVAVTLSNLVLCFLWDYFIYYHLIY